MALRRLIVRNFRNIEKTELQFSPNFNFIYGLNGSGKSSLLEAIAYLGLGRSFRTHKFTNLIGYESTQFSLYGELDKSEQTLKIGISKGRQNKSQLRVNGDNVTRAADLAKLLPLQVINSQSFDLLEGGPGARRRFLDWLVFHVKHDYGATWSQATRCLKQRNALLRAGADQKEFAVWDEQLINLTSTLNLARVEVLEQFMPVAQNYTNQCDYFVEKALQQKEPLKIRFLSGWNKEQTYREILESNFHRDSQLGYTSAGFHKADIRLEVGGKQVHEVYSRGQQKSVISALLLAQLEFLCKRPGSECLLLVDDLPAELDKNNIEMFIKWVSNLTNVQVFISGISINNVVSLWLNITEKEQQTYKVFHVKHGQITEEP